MTNQVYLDPDETVSFWPSEGGEGISPFSIPTHIEAEFKESLGVLRIGFRYPGGETGDAFERLDDSHDPDVELKISRYSQKILGIYFMQPTDADGLRRVADRLYRKALSFPRKAKKFSFQMIAGVLKQYGDQIADAAK